MSLYPCLLGSVESTSRNFRAVLILSRASCCPGGISLLLVMQGYKLVQVAAKCKFVFCLIMTSLS